jgi:hypothetical protein
MHTIVPDGYEIVAQTASPFASQISRTSPESSSSSDMAMKPDYVPESLRWLAKKKTTKVHETLLWVPQGAVGKT